MKVYKIENSSVITKVARAGTAVIITFKSGTVKPFINVSNKKFDAFMAAQSKGAFFNYSIRDNAKHKAG